MVYKTGEMREIEALPKKMAEELFIQAYWG